MSLFRKALASFAVTSTFALVSTTAQAADYQRSQNGVCAANAICNIDFPNVPAGKTLKLTNFSCYLRPVTSSSIFRAQLLLINNASGNILLSVTPGMAVSNTVKVNATDFEAVNVSNDTIAATAVAGQHFRASAEARNATTGNVSTISQFACHISGTLTP